MGEDLLIGLASIVILGIGAQWLAWRFRLPSILLLLIFGFLAGPVTGFLKPDELLGNLLLPVVSLSVGIILFEGGLSLRIEELRGVVGVLRNLLSIGMLVTWIVSAAAAHLILDLGLEMSILLGAILVVTGPTVIVPLLRHVKPVGKAGSLLKWEGILIDPIGAVMAVLVFEVVLQRELQNATAVAAVGFLKTILVGGTIGALGAFTILILLRRFWIPDFLQNPFTLMIVLGSFAISDRLQTESGLLATTVMGSILANQKKVNFKHIVEFKENLRVLLISGLFVLLSARIQIKDVAGMGWESAAFLGVLILVARPAAVALSTLGSELNWRERVFISWMAPRGIVAAAVSSVFALRLEELGDPQGKLLVPLTFLVIVVTVTVYGLTVSPLANRLRVAKANPQGTLIVGGHGWAQEIARALHDEGYEILLVDTNRQNAYKARMAGLPCINANILSSDFLQEVDLTGIRRMLALTSNDEVNSLATLQFVEQFGRSEVYQLIVEGEAKGRKEVAAPHRYGRHLFGPAATYELLDALFAMGAKVKKNRLTEEFDYEALKSHYGGKVTPLFLIEKNGDLVVFTTDNQPVPKPGHILISLVFRPAAEENG